MEKKKLGDKVDILVKSIIMVILYILSYPFWKENGIIVLNPYTITVDFTNWRTWITIITECLTIVAMLLTIVLSYTDLIEKLNEKDSQEGDELL